MVRFRQTAGQEFRFGSEEVAVRLTKFGHACVRVEHDGGVLVIDPGMFTEPAALDGVDAVLITHEHADHLNVDALADALAKRPAVTVHTNASVASRLDALAGVVTSAVDSSWCGVSS